MADKMEVAEPQKPPMATPSGTPLTAASPYRGNIEPTRQWVDMGLCALGMVCFTLLGIFKVLPSEAISSAVTFLATRGIALWQVRKADR